MVQFTNEQMTKFNQERMIILEEIVEQLNDIVFDNKLSKLIITLEEDKNSNNLTYGYVQQNHCYNISCNQNFHKLNITTNSIENLKQVFITIFHELIHIYAYDVLNDSNGACSRQGRYHGKKFKELCDKFDLYTEKNDKIGYITPHNKMNSSTDLTYTFILSNIRDKYNFNCNLEDYFLIKNELSTKKNKR